MIKIISGTVSTSKGLKTSRSGELTLPAAEEARLVRRGVAAYAVRPVTDEQPAAETETAAGAEPAAVETKPAKRAKKAQSAEAEAPSLEAAEPVL
ncbi:MAG: hypothetical protein LIO57_08990 [Oscillospiraceae bacterium]|nr:hypothetical protein [Oscillospiraceae bacterium]